MKSFSDKTNIGENNPLKTVYRMNFYLLFLLTSNPQPPSKNDIELKEKIGYAEKEAQRGENRHKEA